MSRYPQFGVLLNQYLIQLDRSPAWLARHLGVNNSAVSRWLNDGVRPASPETVVRIIDILGISDQRQTLLVAAGYGYQPGHPAQVTENAPAEITRQSRNNIPQPTTPFVGRTAEVAQLAQQLLDPACRLLTLVGPGGIGKTRLAIEVARRLLGHTPHFADGLFFVSLIEVSSIDHFDFALAAALDLTVTSQEQSRAQLLSYLQDKQLLLVLDNFEHLIDGVEVVIQLLAAAPGMTLLVTSRLALGVTEEWFHPVDGLALPQEGKETLEETVSQEMIEVDSVRLFHLCAQRASPDFKLSRETLYVLRICHLVDGMPLAIELAAAWLRLLPCARIVQQLEENLLSLVSPLTNTPPRHRSMEVVLMQSWQMLTPHEATVMETLALFQGGFDEKASIEVAETDLMTLAALTQKALIRPKQLHAGVPGVGTRYYIHEILRHLAGLKAAQRPEARGAAQDRHSHYYLHLLHEQYPLLVSARQRFAAALLDEDYANIRTAWQRAVARQDVARLELALEGLFTFASIRGYIPDVIMLILQAVESLTRDLRPLGSAERAPHSAESITFTKEAGAQKPLVARMLAYVGALYLDLYEPEKAMPFLQQSLSYSKDPRARAFVLARLGFAIRFFNERPNNKAKAIEYLEESLAISKAYGDLAVQAYALERLNILAQTVGDYGESRKRGRESLAIYRQLERPDSVAHLLVDLAVPEINLGDYASARAHLLESLSICRTLGYRQGEAWATFTLGNLAWQGYGDLPAAILHFEKAMPIWRQTGHIAPYCQSLSNLAVLHVRRGEYELALQLAQEALTIARTLQHTHILSFSLAYLAAVYMEVGDLDKAKLTVLEAWPLALSDKRPETLFFCLPVLAGVAIREHRSNRDTAAMAAVVRGLECLVFIQQQPTAEHFHKLWAAQLQREAESVLPAPLIAGAQERGKRLRLEEVAELFPSGEDTAA